MRYEGNLRITKENQNEFKDLSEITGSVYVSGEFEAPNLETVGGYVDVSGEFEAPNLETVGGYVYVSGEFEAPNLETVGGYVYVSGEFEAPNLETVGGCVYVSGEFEAPNLETVGGSVYVYGEAKFEASKLETVGGSVYVYGDAKLPKSISKNNPDAKIICELSLHLALNLKGLALIDGILSWVLSEKTLKGVTVFTVRIVGKSSKSYVVQRGDKFSHGETVKKAIDDLKYKIADRDTSKFEAWKSDLDKKISVEDAIEAYRVVTGACESGVRMFVESIAVPKKLTPRVVLDLTNGKYGSDSFRKFLEM